MTNEVIGTAEVADMLGVSQRQASRVLHRAADTGEIPIVYRSSRGEILVAKDAVERYVDNHRTS